MRAMLCCLIGACERMIDKLIGYGIVILLIIAAWFTFMGPAFGQARRCGDRASLSDFLQKKFGEVPQQNGVGDRGELFELFVSEQGTWTLTIRLPDAQGIVCVMASGNSWSTAPAGARCSGGCG